MSDFLGQLDSNAQTRLYAAEVDRLTKERDNLAAAYENVLKIKDQALIERDHLREALEPGKCAAIVDGMWREAERLGHPSTSSRHALSYLVDEIEKLRRVYEAARVAWPYLKDAADEPNPKDMLWELLQEYKASQ